MDIDNNTPLERESNIKKTKMKKKDFYKECEIVSSLLHSVFTLEEDLVYDIGDLNTVKYSNIEVSKAKVWLKKMINIRKGIKEIIVDGEVLQAKLEKLILKYFPLIELKNSKFEIKSSTSTFYSNEIQKIVFYLFQQKARSIDSAIVVHERFNAIHLMVGLGEYWEISGSKWYLNEGARIIIDLLIEKQRDMVNDEIEIINLLVRKRKRNLIY